MSIESIPIDRATGKDLLVLPGPGSLNPVVIAHTVGQAIGYFASITETTAGTYTAATADAGTSLVLTDLLISSKKKTLADLTIRFTDGTDSVDIFDPDVSAELNLVVPIMGRWMGWAGADVEVETNANVAFTITVGYYRIAGGDDFATWDAQR